MNVLVNNQMQAKLADFGLAALKTASSSQSYAVDQGNIPKGSLLWMAPELFKQRAKRTTATDMDSYAMLLCELASPELPFSDAQGNTDLVQKWICDGERETFDNEITPNTPEIYKAVAESCCDQDPTKRLSASDALTKLQQLKQSSNSPLPVSKVELNNDDNNNNNNITDSFVGNLYANTEDKSPHTSAELSSTTGFMGNVYARSSSKGTYHPAPKRKKQTQNIVPPKTETNRYMANIYTGNQNEGHQGGKATNNQDGYLGNVYK